MADVEDTEEETGLGVSDEKRAKRQRILDKRSGADEKRKWAQEDNAELTKRRKAMMPESITEPRCRVCTHPHREWIEQLIAEGFGPSVIARRCPPNEEGKLVDRRSVTTHYQEHMDLEQARIRAELEEEAANLRQDADNNPRGVLTDRGMLKVLARKAYEDAMNGLTTVEPRDLIQMLKLYNDIEVKTSGSKAEENEVAMRIFTRAIQNILDKEEIDAIVIEVQRLRGMDDIQAELEGLLIPQLEAAEVIDDSDTEQ